MATDYTMAVYGYLRRLGQPGETVLANVEKFLQDEFDIPDHQLIATRTRISHDLQERGLIYKEKKRSRYVTLLK